MVLGDEGVPGLLGAAAVDELDAGALDVREGEERLGAQPPEAVGLVGRDVVAVLRVRGLVRPQLPVRAGAAVEETPREIK